MQVTGLQAGTAVPATAVVDATLASIDSNANEASTLEVKTPAVQPAAPKASRKAKSKTTTDNSEPDEDKVDVTMLRREPGVAKLKRITRGNNPRTHFDEAEMAELIQSVKVHGVMQPILVRPLDAAVIDGEALFAIIAGERRYRAALAAHGEDYVMPLLIIECTEEEAAVLSHIENTMRADMSPTEEAVSAAKVVGQVRGDRDEAARLLGWSRATLDKRLALMNCSELVRTTLNERKIRLGHAELFAALAKESQDKLLPAVLERSLSVTDLKGLIEKAAAKLSAALFDKKDCAGCQHNSSVQGTMFGEAITDGSCTNSVCYKAKTESHLEGMKDALKEEYPVIRIVRVGDNFSQVTIRADGPMGVGEVQAEACRGCADFGAAISALPEHLGKTFKGQCFNPECNQKKVAENIRVQTEAKQAAAAQAAGTATKDAPKGAAAAGAKEKPAEVKTSVNEGAQLKEYREKLWRKAMQVEVSKDYQRSVQYLVALALTGNIRHVDQMGMVKVFESVLGEKRASELEGVANQVEQLDPDRLDRTVKMMAVSAMHALPVHDLVRLAKHINLDLTKHWKMDAVFLKMFSKIEIQMIAKAVGLDKAIGDGFNKLFTEKKDDLIKKLLEVPDFDYSATIPQSIQPK